MLSNPWAYVPFFLAIGAAVGMVSGMVGLGGGVMVIPLLTLLGYRQALANGTSIAMLLPPIGIFAFFTYYRNGNVNLPVAMLLATGFAVGGYFGGKFANSISDTTLRRLFGFFLLYVSGMTLFRGDGRVRSVGYTLLVMAAYGAAYLGMLATGRRWSRSVSAPAVFNAHQAREMGPDYEI